MDERCCNCGRVFAAGEVAINTPHGLRHEERCVADDNPAASFRDDDK